VLRALLWIVLALTAFYAMTGIVFTCEYSYSLVLKPWPMWGWGFGEESDCYWSTMHPGVPEPWWLDAPRLIYASWEDRGGDNLRVAYLIGWFATALLWLVVGVVALFNLTQRLRKASP
jgi:hypothetical protein